MAIGSHLRKVTLIGAALTNFAAGLAGISAQAGGKGRVAEQRVTVHNLARLIPTLPSLEVSILRQSRRLYGCWPLKGA
jgi:hypothetical protein